MGYSDDLKNGNWQQKRLEIMQRDNFKCLCCGSGNNLVVHHLYYKYGLKPWEYKSDSLVTLCDNCHSKLHDELAEKAGILAFEMLAGVKINNKPPKAEAPTQLPQDFWSIEKIISDGWNNLMKDFMASDNAAYRVLLNVTMMSYEKPNIIEMYYDGEENLSMILKYSTKIVNYYRQHTNIKDLQIKLKCDSLFAQTS